MKSSERLRGFFVDVIQFYSSIFQISPNKNQGKATNPCPGCKTAILNLLSRNCFLCFERLMYVFVADNSDYNRNK